MIFIKKEIVILEDPVVEEEIDGDVEVFTEYDFENMEFGLDALAAMEAEDDTYEGIEEYDREEEDLEAETANYIRNRESVMTDEEIEDLISRYTMIKDRKNSTFREIIGIVKDLRRAVEESRKKHGNIHFNSDDDDDRKDDVRMMTKKEATLIVDGILAERLPKYFLAFEHFKRDSFKLVGFTLGFTIVMAIITFTALAVLIPMTWFTVVSVANMIALYRDMERTKLVIVKEIDRIQKTIATLDKKNDRERINQLTAIMNALIRVTGYSKNSEEWKRLTNPENMKRIMESIAYHGEEFGFKEIVINILEADIGDELAGNLSGTPDKPKKEKKKPEEDKEEKEPEANVEDNLSGGGDGVGAFNDDDGTGDEQPETDGADEADEEPVAGVGVTDEGDSDEYGGANVEDEMNNSDAFGGDSEDGTEDKSSEEEKKRKLTYALNNLDALHRKYKMFYDDFISSDIYRIIHQDAENTNRKNIVLLVKELELALTSLDDYIMSGDKSAYPIVALKLTTFQALLKKIDNTIYEIIIKDAEVDNNDKDGTPKKKRK
jgi:hypothetical protein